MDRASEGLRLEGSPNFPPGFDPASGGPVDRPTAIALIRQADELMEASEPDQALPLYARTVGAPDKDVAAAGLFGVGNALYRLDRDGEALDAWERVTAMGETPATYRAWRQVAAARVRAKDLEGALDAYRQCERRAPAADKGLIASRLGWLSKETGNSRAAGHYFARSRGDALPPDDPSPIGRRLVELGDRGRRVAARVPLSRATATDQAAAGGVLRAPVEPGVRSKLFGAVDGRRSGTCGPCSGTSSQPAPTLRPKCFSCGSRAEARPRSPSTCSDMPRRWTTPCSGYDAKWRITSRPGSRRPPADIRGPRTIGPLGRGRPDSIGAAAGVAQLAAQPTCNRQVPGSSPGVGSSVTWPFVSSAWSAIVSWPRLGLTHDLPPSRSIWLTIGHRPDLGRPFELACPAPFETGQDDDRVSSAIVGVEHE